MSSTWSEVEETGLGKVTPVGWLRILVRGVILGVVTFGCLLILLLVRLIEQPIFGAKRPITPFITQFVCKSAFVILGIKYRQRGKIMKGQGAVVSNHASWLDIFSLNARKRIYFVSKSEVAKWPGIGWLAKATGTVFIRRSSRDASKQIEIFRNRLALGHKLLFFPEGTSTDGLRVLPFKSTLFAAFFDPELRKDLRIQPVTLVYRYPDESEPRFYGWWGDMDFGSHLLKTMASRKQGSVELVCHEPVYVCDFPDRKALAKYCEETVRSGMDPKFHAITEDVLSIP